MHRGALAFALTLAGCGLFNTDDAENAAGRGPKAFDPYAGAASGAIRLGLQMYNGCGVLATGEATGKGSANIPYPASCPRLEFQDPVPPADPAPPLSLQAGATYFLNQITITEAVTNLHTDPTNMGAVANWMKTQTRFAALDWDNLGIISDEWIPSEESIGPGIFDHNVHFGNANWQLVTDDTWLLEVLDVDGKVRQSQTYDHVDFLAQNSTAGHSDLVWSNSSLGKPDFLGDLVNHPPQDNGVAFPPAAPTGFRTRVRLDMITSTHPQKSFKLDPGLIGDGAIRLTWSMMPADPFYFPVTFVRPMDIPPTCWKDEARTQPVACDFGLAPEVKLAPPANGKFFVAGEQVQIRLAVRDNAGNYLHPIDRLPTYNQMLRNEANGLLYIDFPSLLVFGERDTIMAVGLSGPHQNMRPSYEFQDRETFFVAPINLLGTEIAGANAVPGARDVPLPTSQVVTLPADAKPGTYTVYFKVHRQFLGERFTKIGFTDFQVGQEERTQFPGRVGNCQICHRGVISLDNVRHGLPVDRVEACKTCHNRNDAQVARVASQAVIHNVHMRSPRFPKDKNDCTLCHLTRESALRPSFLVCGSCHPTPHGGQYWDLPFISDYGADNRGIWTNCAAMCHAQTPPTAHILPVE